MYEFLQYQVADVMTAAPIVIAPTTRLADAEAIFEQHDFNSLPVVEHGELVGVLTKLDLLKAFAFTSRTVVPPYEDIMNQPVAVVMTRDLFTVEADSPLTRVLQKMIDTRYKSFPVVAGRRLVGVVAREDLLRALRQAAAGTPPPRRSSTPS